MMYENSITTYNNETKGSSSLLAIPYLSCTFIQKIMLIYSTALMGGVT